MMNEHIYPTPKGFIHYWTNDIRAERHTLVFLPGLSADHHLFDKQIETFENEYNVIEADLPYDIACPCLLLCGEKDKAGDTRKFNRKWSAGEGLPIEWIPGAGHNSNTDQPEMVNQLISAFINKIK